MRRSRIILLLLLIYQSLFLNVLLPGHTRGAITTDGKHTAEICCLCKACCARLPSGKTVDESSFPSKRDRDHCALCEFAVGLISIPVIRLTLPELGLLEILPVARPSVIISLDRISTYLACGPPFSISRLYI